MDFAQWAWVAWWFVGFPISVFFCIKFAVVWIQAKQRAHKEAAEGPALPADASGKLDIRRADPEVREQFAEVMMVWSTSSPRQKRWLERKLRQRLKKGGVHPDHVEEVIAMMRSGVMPDAF